MTLLGTLRDEEEVFWPLVWISSQRTLGDAQLVFNIKNTIKLAWISFEWDVIWTTLNFLLNAVFDGS